MRWKMRAALSAAVAGAFLVSGTTAALAAETTVWMKNNASRLMTVDGCGVTQSGSGELDKVWAMENTNCSGSIGLRIKYKPGSTTYTTSVLWGGSKATWSATNITYVQVSH